MAAYAALVSAMDLIDDIENHHSPPISMDKNQVQSLTESVTFLQKFLQGYSSPLADDDEAADPLQLRIMEAAYFAEDVIEFHIVDKIQKSRYKIQPSRSKTFFNWFRGIKNVSLNRDDGGNSLYEDLQQVIEEMELTKRVAMKIDTEKAMVHPVPVSASASSSSFSSSLAGQNSLIVCSDDIVLGIMEKLVWGPPNRQVLPIVGMGGIGKTTLATTIYSKPLIKEHFDVCVWATISQQYNITQILHQLLFPIIEMDNKEDELGSKLYQYLFGRRFLIVMDDMWSIDAWDKIQHFFPDNENGSRILVTTRLSHLSSQLNNNYCLQMEFLDEFHSWDLFSRTVFGEESCPLELLEIGKEIVKNCRGLPLSIVVVGGLLKEMEQTQGCWETIKDNLTLVVNLDHDKHCLRLLKLSYHHLPVYLKPCFLYMGVFKEDEDILVSRLIKLWASEGFVKSMNGKSLETIAKGFLKDLVDRNLILIDRLGSAGNIKFCKIHDLLRDICLRESGKYDFYHVIERGSPQHIKNQRRVVIRKKTSNPHQVVDAAQCTSHTTRSLICEQPNVPWCQLNGGLLRTLDTYHIILEESHVQNVVVSQCVNLRRLVVTVHSMSPFLASSLNLLWNLHTLIVNCWDEWTMLVGFWKMPQLRHVEFTQGPFSLPDPPSEEGDDVVVMENLHTLKGVKNFKCGEEVVKRIPNIKKLEIEYHKGDDDYCLSNVKYLCELESLYISSVSIKVASLHNLSFPQSLKCLSLWMESEFEWEEVLEKIGSLPFLEKLRLCDGCFGRGEWEVGEGRFPALKYLEVMWCRGLRQWTSRGGSIFPRLEQLHLFELDELKGIPYEIGDIATLQNVWLIHCSESAVMSAKDIVDEQVELQGDELPFHVEVWILDVDEEALRSFTTPNFKVNDY